MGNHTRSAAADPATAPENPRPPLQQTLPHLLALVAGMKGCPPERGLWREALNLAVGRTQTFRDRGRPVKAHVVVLVAWALYGRADRAGIVAGFPARVLAADTRLSERHVKAGIAVIERLRLAKRTRPSRRRPAFLRLNVGGLDWPMVYAQAAELHPTAPAAAGAEWGHTVTTGPTLPGLSGDTRSPLSGDTRSPLKGSTEGQSVQQQQQAPVEAEVCEPEPAALRARKPTERQLRGIADMGAELERAGIEPHGPERPVTRLQASETFQQRKAQVRALRGPRGGEYQRMNRTRESAETAAMAIRADLADRSDGGPDFDTDAEAAEYEAARRVSAARQRGRIQGLVDGRREQAQDGLNAAIERCKRRFAKP